MNVALDMCGDSIMTTKLAVYSLLTMSFLNSMKISMAAAFLGVELKAIAVVVVLSMVNTVVFVDELIDVQV